MKKFLDNKLVLILSMLLVGIFIGYLISGSGQQPPAGAEHQHTESAHHHEGISSDQWTCSMHPQIRQQEPGDCPICGMDLIPVAASSKASQNPMVTQLSPEAVAMANIHTTKVSGVSSEDRVFLTGKIQPDEQRQATITAKFPGRIEQLYVDFTGKVVRRGERLARIYSPDLIAAQQELLEAMNTKSTFPELYEAARRKLQHWKLNESQIIHLETTGKVTDQFDILADKSGVVIAKNVTVGDYVNTGTILFNVSDLSRLWVMLDAYESDLPFVHLGDPLEFTVSAVPGKTFHAKVDFVNPVINPETRAASVRAEVVNEGEELKPEMFVNAAIQIGTSTGQSTLTIPRTALLWSGKRSVVYVKVPGTETPSYEMREVTAASRMGEMWLVESGIEPGEEIVTNGAFAIDAAAQLAGNYSMLKRPEIKTMEVPVAFREQITRVADAYFEMKKGLVESNPEAARRAAGQLYNSMQKVDGQQLQPKAIQSWAALKKNISQQQEQIANAPELVVMRQHFSHLSENILEMTELFGLQKGKLYKNHCPMALDDQGAYWLSEVEDIRNPYFGDAMLKCGEVKETYLQGQPVFKSGDQHKQSLTEFHNH